jgi:hypothetical protein
MKGIGQPTPVFTGLLKNDVMPTIGGMQIDRSDKRSHPETAIETVGLV